MATLAAPPLDAVREDAPRAPIIEVRDLTVEYNGEAALDAVSFDVLRGERIAVIGPNGAGKSTLIKALMGLVQPQRGHVTLHTAPTRVGYVPQHEDINWSFPVTVWDVVMMGCARRIGWFRQPRAEHKRIVEQALARVDMLALRGRQIGELSGGQRRRVFIARALAQQADLLILDEPFAGVDAGAQADLMDVLNLLNRDGMTIVFSTHDLDLAFQQFDKVLALRRRLVAFGTAQAIDNVHTLTQLYGKRLVHTHDGREVSLFIEDLARLNCDDCK